LVYILILSPVKYSVFSIRLFVFVSWWMVISVLVRVWVLESNWVFELLGYWR
jgi:hypothetical protein